MAYLKNKHLANIKKWNLDLSKLKDEVYKGYIVAPKDIKEFKGFEELFGFEIKEITGYLSFWNCTSLTSVSNLPDCVGYNLSFHECTSLTSVSNLPDCVGGYLNFYKCTSLTSIGKMPSVVKGGIYTGNCPFFEGMTEQQIREKYNTSQILYTYLDFKLDRSGYITHNSKST